MNTVNYGLDTNENLSWFSFIQSEIKEEYTNDRNACHDISVRRGIHIIAMILNYCETGTTICYAMDISIPRRMNSHTSYAV